MMCNAFGIVNFEGTNVNVSGLQDHRPVGAFSFLGRYRLIDFPISNMSNSGVNHIQVYVKRKPRSLIEHLGTGRHYNINSKRGKLHILYGEHTVESSFYNHDIAAFRANMNAIEEVNYPYVIIVPSYMIYTMDYSELLEKHISSGADISMVYHSVDNAKEAFINCDVLNVNKQKGVLSIDKNRGNYKSRNISLETYVLSKELFIELVNKAANTSSLYSFRDIVNEECSELDIRGVLHRGYLAAINDFKSYYNANMGLIEYDTIMELFDEEWPIYTRTNDSPPTQYFESSKVSHSVVSNGCAIEGEIENSVIGRGCVVKKGAVIKNSVILPGVYIGEDVQVDGVVVDKKAKITRMKELKADKNNPMYVKRNDRI
ncbi:MAG: glucose-1-phosphate adenylyltransferase subunit GlgD [Erysipelotrichaceae bacterium]